MATQCRGTKTKRINRHKLAVIQAYIIIGTLVLIGFIGGLVVGRATAPKKQVTVTETVEVPSYEADSLPVAEEVTYFDVPLSHSLQRYIYEVCADENVPVSLIIAMIDQESKFNPEVVSKTGDYGLMQINTINHEWLAEEYRTADMLDPYQNVFCGIKVIGSYIQNYNDYCLALMAYNMGDYGAKKAWENGIKSTSYSESVPRLERLYLTTPQKDYAVVTQSIGRIARTFEGKSDPIAYDFVDDIAYLVKSYKKRCTTYRKNGCYFVKEGGTSPCD